ncbi:MAG: hypothetical protein JWP87_654 [Labilithrix sp.]|nr:hypothetical protein [Labilithrix sp.]
MRARGIGTCSGCRRSTGACSETSGRSCATASSATAAPSAADREGAAASATASASDVEGSAASAASTARRSASAAVMLVGSRRANGSLDELDELLAHGAPELRRLASWMDGFVAEVIDRA